MAFCRQTTGEKGGVFGQTNDCTRVCLVYGPSRLAVQAKNLAMPRKLGLRLVASQAKFCSTKNNL